MMTASRLFRRRRASTASARRSGLVDSLEPRVLLSAQLVKDLVPGPDGGQPLVMAALGKRLAFSTGGQQPGLWVSDGTDAGTTRIAAAPIVFDAQGRPAVASATYNALFYNGDGGLWKTDGTAAGTTLVKAFEPPFSGGADGMTESGGVVYFSHKDPWFGTELWRTDGTADGTVIVKDLYPGAYAFNGQPGGSSPANLTDVNGTLFFSAVAPGTHGPALFKSDGTPAGTVLVKDYNATNNTADPFQFTDVNGTLFFAGYDGEHGFELWKSDGTADGTAMVSDLFPGPVGSLFPQGGMVALGDQVLFTARDGNTALSLWRSDGTDAGTSPVKTLAPSSGGSFSMPGALTRVGTSRAFFTNNHQSELWVTDGTPDGTSLVKAFPVNLDQGISGLTAGGGTLFFTVNDGTSGYEAWESDGTAAGTVRLDDINPGPADSRPELYTPVDGSAFFVANDGQHGNELWKTDFPIGTPAAPGPLVATPASGTEMALSWADHSDNEAAFVLERSTSATFATVASSITLLPDATHYLDTGLASGATYFYRLRALDRAGASSNATASAATPVAPAAPTAVTATPASQARVDLAWADNSSDEQGFRIERSAVSNFSTIDATFNVGANVTSFRDTSVSPETNYFYRVGAVGPAGRSAAPRARAATPGLPPTGLEGWGVSANGISLQWTNPQSANSFSLRVERAGPGEDFSDALSLSSSSSSYSEGSRRPNTVYRYRVSAVGPFGRTLPSNEVSATTLPPVLATLVKDLNTKDGGAGSNPSPVVALDGVGYFAAEDDALGRELWRTDGTQSGTRRVLDLNPGPNGGVGFYPGSETDTGTDMVAFNGALYFRGNDGSHGSELWKSDGTEPGTVLVGDTFPGGDAGVAPAWLTVVNNTLFFSSISDGELWKSDGTAAGTVRVKDIVPGTGASQPRDLAACNGALYFSADDGTNGRELWRSDGTDAGTYRISDIAPGPGSSGGNADPRSLTPAGNSLYFSASNLTVGRELWKTDGTAAGTVLVKDIYSGPQWSEPQNLFADGSALLFTARDATSGFELWRSDGTEAGTVQLADLLPGQAESTPFAFTAFKGRTYFLAHREGLSMSLYQTDGTTAGTTLVKQLPDGYIEVPPKMIVIGDSLYLISLQTDDTGNRALWKSDGTASGTVVVSGPLPDFPRGGTLSALGNLVMFPAAENTQGFGGEPWRSDGTPGGTFQLKNIRVLNGSSSPRNLTAANGQLFFTTADDSGVGAGLWRSDGTDPGTTMILPGTVSNLIAASDRLFFLDSPAESGQELWTSDGTAAGTHLVKDITPGAVGSVILGLIAAPDGSVYFASRAADSGNFAYKLWRSDGTDAGTVQLSDVIVAAETGSQQGPFLMPAGNTVFFRASGVGTGLELWKTDGTPAGTSLLKDIFPGAGGSVPTRLTNVNGTLYFSANDQAGPARTFRSDGTPAGTVRVDSIGGSPPPGIPTALGNLLIFPANDGTTGNELWRSDRTPEGTYLLSDIYPGTQSSAASNLLAVGESLYFVASDASNGRNLWRTDGTAAGTSLLRRVSDPSSGSPFSMLNVNGTLFYFEGGSLWRSDGTRAGTVQVLQSIESPGEFPPLGSGAAPIGNTLYVRGTDPAHGRELWSVATTPPAAPTAPSATLLGGGLTRVTWQDASADETGFLVDRLVGARAGAVAAAGDVVDRTFFVAANDTSFTDSTAGGAYRYRVRAVNAAGSSTPTADVTPAGVPHSSVVGRYALDGAAPAAGKVALLPGSVATFTNVLTAAKGITGIAIDLAGLPAGTLLSSADFALEVGTGGNWAALAAAPAVTVLSGGGAAGQDRIMLTLPNGSVRNSWLRVTVKATPATGLSTPDVFYFGNLVGDTGNDRGTPTVNAADYALTRAAVLKTDSASLNRYDFNRDGRIDARDVLIVRLNQRHALPLLTAPATATPSVAFGDSTIPAALVPARRPARRGVLEDGAATMLS